MTKVDLSESKYKAFFEKLASDDGFRDAVKRDPGAVLAEHGIDVDPSVVFKTKVKLPSKKALNKNLGTYVDRLSTMDDLMVFIR